MPIPVITGPTAVGKTALSIRLAQRLDADIISFDSRQLYRGMDIGTAKPSVSERTDVQHHFVDELDPTEPFSAGAYARYAWERITELRSEGKRVVCVGGSTLYLRALTRGIAHIPEVSNVTRLAVEQRLVEEGADVLFAELSRVDPQAAATMDATKTQRLVRALSVYQETGRPLSRFHEQHESPPFAFKVVVLDRNRDELYSRINQRVDEMLEQGLIDEVRRLLDSGVPADVNAMRTIGYSEPVQYLRGEIEYEEMRRLIKRNTRRYAKRQLTWFRSDGMNVWLPASTSVDELVEVFEAEDEGNA